MDVIQIEYMIESYELKGFELDHCLFDMSPLCIFYYKKNSQFLVENIIKDRYLHEKTGIFQEM